MCSGTRADNAPLMSAASGDQPWSAALVNPAERRLMRWSSPEDTGPESGQGFLPAVVELTHYGSESQILKVKMLNLLQPVTPKGPLCLAPLTLCCCPSSRKRHYFRLLIQSQEPVELPPIYLHKSGNFCFCARNVHGKKVSSPE